MKTAFKKNLKVVLTFILFTSCKLSQAQNTMLTISGLRSTKGQIMIYIFKDQVSYKNNQPLKKLFIEKKDVVNGIMVFTCSIEPGYYGLTMLDDENKNSEMDKNWVSFPKEGFGFSNFYMDGLSRPDFTDFKIKIEPKGNKVTFKVKYM